MKLFYRPLSSLVQPWRNICTTRFPNLISAYTVIKQLIGKNDFFILFSVLDKEQKTQKLKIALLLIPIKWVKKNPHLVVCTFLSKQQIEFHDPIRNFRKLPIITHFNGCCWYVKAKSNLDEMKISLQVWWLKLLLSWWRNNYRVQWWGINTFILQFIKGQTDTSRKLNKLQSRRFGCHLR